MSYSIGTNSGVNMTLERTLSIKPDAVAKNKIGSVLQKLEQGGLKIVAAKMMHLSTKQAEDFFYGP